MRNLAVWLLLAALTCARAFAQVPGQTGPERALTVESLECRGNETTACQFILGQVYLAEGDLVDEEELQNAKLRLLFLRNFAAVSIHLEKGSARGKARVVVDVVEADPVTTELTTQIFSQDTSFGQLVSGRATNYNLFGNGKILDARLAAVTDYAGPTIEEYLARVQYVDPHLFGSKRNFFNLGASYFLGTLNRRNGDSIHNEYLTLETAIGRRLWNFSYATLGFQHRPIAESFGRTRSNEGLVTTIGGRSEDVLVFGFGWNSEDDAYFPTRGSLLAANVVNADDNSESRSLFYRRTWQWHDFVWAAEYQSTSAWTLRIARNFDFEPARRARWFLSANSFLDARNNTGLSIRSVGATAGLLFETPRMGIVDLRLFYSRDLRQ